MPNEILYDVSTVKNLATRWYSEGITGIGATNERLAKIYLRFISQLAGNRSALAYLVFCLSYFIWTDKFGWTIRNLLTKPMFVPKDITTCGSSGATTSFLDYSKRRTIHTRKR